MATESEFSSVEAFVDFLLEDDRDTFTAFELQSLRQGMNRDLGESRVLRHELEGYGLKLADRPHAKRVRTLGNSSDNDRWYGPGSSPCHGGSGWDNIVRMVDRVC